MASLNSHPVSQWDRSPSGSRAPTYGYQNQEPPSPVSPIFSQRQQQDQSLSQDFNRLSVGVERSQGYQQNASYGNEHYYPDRPSINVEPPPSYPPPRYSSHESDRSYRSHSSSLGSHDNGNYQVAVRERSNSTRSNKSHRSHRSHSGTVGSRENGNNQLAVRDSSNYQLARSVSTDDDLTSEDAAILQETTAWIPLAPSSSRIGDAELEKPVVIPRIDAVGKLTYPLPFLRAYSPALEAFGIDVDQFMTFIDNLAMTQTPPASLQAMEVVGAAIGFVPVPPAMVLGMALETSAVAGYIIAYKRRSKAFFKKVNKDFLNPRGLQASMVKNKDMPEKLGYDRTLPTLMPLRPGAGYVPRRDRRMQILAPYVAPLTEDVPEPMKQRNVLDKWARWQVERKMNSKEKKHRKKADKLRSQEASRRPSNLPEKEQDARRNSWDSTSSIYSSDSEDDETESKKAEHWRLEQINREADRDLKRVGSKEKEVKAIEKWRKKELEKAEKDIAKQDKKAGKVERKADKTEKKHGKKKEKKFKSDLKRADRFEFLVIEKLPSGRRTA